MDGKPKKKVSIQDGENLLPMRNSPNARSSGKFYLPQKSGSSIQHKKAHRKQNSDISDMLPRIVNREHTVFDKRRRTEAVHTERVLARVEHDLG